MHRMFGSTVYERLDVKRPPANEERKVCNFTYNIVGAQVYRTNPDNTKDLVNSPVEIKDVYGSERYARLIQERRSNMKLI